MKQASIEKMILPESVRLALWDRDHGWCQVCGEQIPPWQFVPHHIGYRSAIRHAVVKHQLWNLASLHRRCHERAHKEVKVRRFLEEVAMVRLCEFMILYIEYEDVPKCGHNISFYILVDQWQQFWIRHFGKK